LACNPRAEKCVNAEEFEREWRSDSENNVAENWSKIRNHLFQSGTPHPLFDTNMFDTGIRTGPMSWDVATDGKRFLIITDQTQETSSLNMILNWRPDGGPGTAR
jgi:hypothetical protein